MDRPHLQIANLTAAGAGPEFGALFDAFTQSNPEHGLVFHPDATVLESSERNRAVFVHGEDGVTHGTRGRVGDRSSPLEVGDVALLRPGEALELDAPAQLLVFEVPESFEDSIPTFLRPDFDPRITDTPGGCATQVDAYRRVVLTWLAENGAYNCRALNTHRVRMVDSFSHYHPIVGGFDEMYLVQHVAPSARLYTSDRVAEIERPEQVSADVLDGLVVATPIRTGDLVWVRRGAMHRAVGGVLAHVITVPGFVPGREIGVDHHLRAIDERLGLEGEAALPYHVEASTRAVVK